MTSTQQTRRLVRDADFSLAGRTILEVQTRQNVIGRALPLGEIGPAYLRHIRLTEPTEEDVEWARQKIREKCMNRTLLVALLALVACDFSRPPEP